MNTEQLQMILNAFDDASSGAFIVGLLYVLKSYFTFLIGAATIVYLGNKVLKLLSSLSNTSYIWRLARLDGGYGADRKRMKLIIDAGMDKLGE